MRIVSEKQIPARAEHTCCLCDCPIHKGDIYLKTVAEDGGQLLNYATHKECKYFTIKTRLCEDPETTSEIFKETVFEKVKEHGLEDWQNKSVKELVDLLVFRVELS